MTYYIRIPEELHNIAFYNAISQKCSKQRIEKARRFKKLQDRIISCTVFVLLRYALSEKYGYQKMPYFYFNAYGKPILTDKNIHFSLSHSGNFATVALSDSPIGADIQQNIKSSYDIAEMICSQHEKTLFDKGMELTRIWAVKESFFKCIGTGLPEQFDTYDICVSADECFKANGKNFTIMKIPDACISVCSNKKESIREITSRELIYFSGGQYVY